MLLFHAVIAPLRAIKITDINKTLDEMNDTICISDTPLLLSLRI